ncbi:MAG: hypothetical protein A2V90_06825 [Gammaproteobacteria bacterium RBG_16_57_12]|nr:MAG: hypothetical protein A2V90_06825 [Gammaproteobacteria bacterium RBG_16_57_12]
MEQEIEKPFARQILKSMPFGIMVTDQQGNIAWTNDLMRDLIDVSTSGSGHGAAQLQQAAVTFLNDQRLISLTDPVDSTEIWIRHSEFPIKDDTGRALAVHFYEDVSEARDLRQQRDQLEEKLQKLTPVDPLTNLPSRHAILQSLTPLVSLSRRYAKPLSIILLEISNLDQFDEEHGEPTAGEVLVSLSRLLKDQMRWADLIGRYDNNQFLLVLPETARDDAVKLVDKIHPMISQLDVPELPFGPVALTPKYGISQWAKGDDMRRLMQRATQALHTARATEATPVEIL